MKKWQLKRFFKNLWNKIRISFMQPQSITAIILILIAIVSLYFSHKTEGTFLSSILSNIFAGLVTGVAICFISGIKNYSINNVDNKIEWLERLHEECLDFMKLNKTILKAKNNDNLDNELYELICSANGINTTIGQSQFNKTLSFNLIKFCKDKLDYDIEVTNELYATVREKILSNDNSNLSVKDIINLFKDVNHAITCFNGAIVNKLTELKAKKSNFGKSII